MDFVLNDYSLNGQFKTTEDFAMWIHAEWVKMFDYLLEHRFPVFKKSDFYSRRITDEEELKDLLQITGDPLVSKIRLFIINSAYSEPYWDVEGIGKTDLSSTYTVSAPKEHVVK